MINDLIRQIHDHPAQVVAAITGAGSRAIACLLEMPGASRTLLEATVPYSYESLTGYLGFLVERAANETTAISLAAAAYARARHLAGADQPVLGLSCTAAIATDYLRQGDHRAYVACRDSSGVTVYFLTFQKGLRKRIQEEEITSRLIIKALVEGCGIKNTYSIPIIYGDQLTTTRYEYPDPIRRLIEGEYQKVTVYGPAAFVPDEPVRAGVLPGSFNPAHAGHRELARVAREMLGMPVVYEISTHNVDKPPLTAGEIEARLPQFAGGDRLILTREPLYRDKAARLPGCVFIIGYDTAARTVNPAYYAGDPQAMRAALDEVRRHGCRFLVAGRMSEGGFKTADDLPIPDGYHDLFEGIPEARFRVDLSSTELRRRRGMGDG